MAIIPVGDFTVNLTQVVLGDEVQTGERMFKVYKAYKNNNQNYCAYVIKQGEIQLRQIDNPCLERDLNFNVLKIEDLGFQEEKEQYIHIGERCDLCLENYLIQRRQYPLSTPEIISILGQIVNGYDSLQNNKFKPIMNPENIYIIMLRDNSIIVKLFLDIYKYKNPNNIKYVKYMAPETLENGNQNDQRSDIFSLGIILYELCYQSHPFQVNNVTSGIRQAILNKQKSILQYNPIDLPKNFNISFDIQNLIRQMLFYNPAHRITWQKLKGFNQLNPKFIILNNKYYINLEKPLGSGAQGIIFEARSLEKQQDLFAAKRISNQSSDYQREINIYKKIQEQNPYSPNVIQICEIINFQNQYTFIIMEKCDENLKEYLGRNSSLLTDSDLIDIIYQITLGYIFLKNLHIIHRDLKPQNILVKLENKPLFKIIDLGLGKQLTKNELAITKVGTLRYLAPEVFHINERYDHQCDIFSLGVIFYEMVYQYSYAQISNVQELQSFVEKFKQNSNIITYSSKNASGRIINPNIINLIQSMLQYDPKKRIAWEEFKVQLESIKINAHPKIKLINLPNQQQNFSNNIIYNQQHIINNARYYGNSSQTQNGINMLDQSKSQQGMQEIKQGQLEIKEEKYERNENEQEVKVEKHMRKQEKKISLYCPSLNELDGHQQEQQQQQQVQNHNNQNHCNDKIINYYNSNLYLPPAQTNQNIQKGEYDQQYKIVENQNLNEKRELNSAKLEEFYTCLSKSVEQSFHQNSMGVDSIIASLLIAIYKIRESIKLCKQQGLDKLKETIIIFYLLNLATDVFLDSLFILKETKRIILFGQEFLIEQSFLSNIMFQTIILMKRYTRLDWNYSFQTLFNTKDSAEIKDYIQKIQNYHEILGKQSNQSCLDGLEYFYEQYCKLKAQIIFFPQILKFDMDQIYEIHQIKDIKSLKEYIKETKLWLIGPQI